MAPWLDRLIKHKNIFCKFSLKFKIQSLFSYYEIYKNKIMKVKHTLFVLIIGLLLTFIGALLKITHMEIGPANGNNLLTIGMWIEMIGGILFLYKLFTNKKFKDFLNS